MYFFLYCVFIYFKVICFCVCYLRMQMQTLCRAVEISISNSYNTSVKIFYGRLTEVFIGSPFCDKVHEGQVKRNHLSWICREPRWMSSLNRELSRPLPLVARKLRIQDNISEPIEIEEMSRHLRLRSRGKEDNQTLPERRTFAFCLRGFWVILWTLEREVRFLKFVMNFLKGVG